MENLFFLNANQELENGREAQIKVSSTFSKVVGYRGKAPVRAPQSAKSPGRAGKKAVQPPDPARPKRFCRQRRQTAPGTSSLPVYGCTGFRYPAQLLLRIKMQKYQSKSKHKVLRFTDKEPPFCVTAAQREVRLLFIQKKSEKFSKTVWYFSPL